MSSPARSESCRKCGVILTCYVDGRKRFRALRLAEFTASPIENAAIVTSSTPREG